MFKRLFTTVLATVMLFTAVPQAMAAKKSDNFSKNTRNIYNLWGDFETVEQMQQATTAGIVDPKSGLDKTTEILLVSGGADSSKKALQVNMASADSTDYINFHFPGIPKEKYKFSFWLKTDAPGAESISLMMEYFKWDQTKKFTIPLVANNGQWYKYEYVWTCDDNDKNYNLGYGGTANIRIALNGCEGPYTYYFDRLSVEPYGFVEWDYSAVNTHYNYLMGNVKTEPKYGNVDSTGYTDVASHWAQPVIRSLSSAGYVNGMGDGTFAPDKSVTRAEFIKMATGIFADRQVSYDGRYKDVENGSWYAPYIAKADSYVILAEELKTGSMLRPETPITREEAASIIAKAAEYKGAKKGKTVSFTDSDKVSDWAKTAVENASSYGIINGYGDGTFKPDNKITRAEAAQMLLKVIEITDRMNIYVDAVNGDDKNDGTQSAPLKTVEAARDMAAKYAENMKNDITIYIRGEHYFDKTFMLNERHSGKNGFDIVYTSWGEDKAIFTMAKKFTGFELHDADKNIWKTYVGKGTYSRQAFFNEVRGIRSRTVGYLDNCELFDNKYYLCDNLELLDIAHPEDIDAVYHVYWTNNRYLVRSITEQDGKARIDFGDYFYENQYRVANTDVGKKTNRKTPSFLENAYEFLDEAGEWYLNKYDGYMYYIPRSGENMETMECKIPLGEELMRAEGSSYNNKLTNVTFDNIVFEGTTWFRIDEKGGFAPLQNNLLTGTRENGNDGKTGQSVGGAVELQKCENITLTNNVFRHMALTALELMNGTKYITIEGNEFYDTSSHAMLIDDVSLAGWFSSKPEEMWCEYLNINNNYIHHVAVEYNGSAAVGIGFVRHTDFTHNEISYAPYSGLHLGWGWVQYIDSSSIIYDLEVSHNYIHDVMYGRVNDGGAIYNLGAGSVENDSTPDAPNDGLNKNRIINNYIVNCWNSDGIYPDQGSSNIYIANNVFDKGEYVINSTYNFDRTIHTPDQFYWLHMHSANISYITTENNYSTHDYAYKQNYMNQLESSIEPVKLYPDANWPQEALDIIADTGIEEKYRANFDLTGPKIFVGNNKWQQVEVGKSVDPGLLILGDDNTSYPVSDYDVRWWFDDSSALSYEDGKIVAHKEGIYEAEAWVTVDGIEMSQHYMFECFGGIKEVKFNENAVNLISGSEAALKATAYTTVTEKNVTTEPDFTANIKVEDPSVAKVELDEESHQYRITGLARGKTKITGTFIYQGKSYPVNVDIAVITYGTEEAAKLPYREVAIYQNWNRGQSAVEGGVKVGASPAHWLGEKIENELIAFDMEIDPGSGWPSIAFCDNNTMSDYTSNDCYMIGFREDHIEFQRWNKGVRTCFFGRSGLSPIAGAGVPNTGDDKIYEYNKRMSVVIGALDTPEGTRIILTINGENIIDYLDNSDKRLPSIGYYVTYNPAPGGMKYYPYTGITNE